MRQPSRAEGSCGIGCRAWWTPSFQWCERTREDFQLGPQIEELLEQRKRREEMTQTYGRWRAKQKEDPAVCRMMKFVDDPKKGDGESLTLEFETIPIWRPGHPMRGR